MTASIRLPTPAELALLGLSEGSALPSGGHSTHGVYFTGTGTSRSYVADLNRELGHSMVSGSLNLRLCSPTTLSVPRVLVIGGQQWEAVPVLLEDCAVGVHAWRKDLHDSTFLEVFAPLRLAPLLGLECGDRVAVRLLAGTDLADGSG